MILEPAGLEDFEAVNALACQVNDLHTQWRPDIYVHNPQPISMEAYGELLEQQLVFVLRSEGKVAAYVMVGYLSISGPGLVSRRILKLDQICVDDACRRQGFGKRIFQALRELAKAQDCTDLQLTCDPHNEAAIAFYEGQGMDVKCIQYHLKV